MTNLSVKPNACILSAMLVGITGCENALSGVQQNTSLDKSVGAALIIRTGTIQGMLLASHIDAERLGPQSH